MSIAGKKRRHKGRSASPFVMLHWHLLDSRGWHALTPRACLAYIYLARFYSGKNNGLIGMAARRLATMMDCNKATASRALRELDDAGFITTMKVGTFSRRDRLASEYRLNNFSCDVTNEPPLRTWDCQRWEAPEAPATVALVPPHGCTRGPLRAKTPPHGITSATVKDQNSHFTVAPSSTHLESNHKVQALDTRTPCTDQQALSPPESIKNNFGPSGAVKTDPRPVALERTEKRKLKPKADDFPELPDYLRREKGH